jgi:hypothetical protein
MAPTPPVPIWPPALYDLLLPQGPIMLLSFEKIRTYLRFPVKFSSNFYGFTGYVSWPEWEYFLEFNKGFYIIFTTKKGEELNMRFKTIFLFVFTLAIVLLMTASCSRHSVYSGPVITKSGPPAHAPAHGYRRKHMHMHGVELVFDSGRGVYVVVGLSDHYYHDGYFFRLRSGIWEMCPKPDGSWKVVSDNSLPKGLRANVKVNSNSRGKGNGKGKGKLEKNVVSVGKMF